MKINLIPNTIGLENDFFGFYYDKFSSGHYQGEIKCRWKEVEKLLSYGSILGIGSGRAFIEDYLASLGKRVVASDICKELRDLSLRFNKNLKEYIIADCRDLPFDGSSFEACYSQGLLEHFKKDEQLEILKEAYCVASKVVVFAVPSPDYCFDGFGKEDRFGIYEWNEILRRVYKRYRIDSYEERLGTIIILEIKKEN